MHRTSASRIPPALRAVPIAAAATILAGGLLAAPAPATAEGGTASGWDWSADPAAEEARRRAAAEAEARAEAERAAAARAAAEDEPDSVAGAISGIMAPNAASAIANDRDLEALRRRAQTGRPR